MSDDRLQRIYDARAWSEANDHLHSARSSRPFLWRVVCRKNPDSRIWRALSGSDIRQREEYERQMYERAFGD